MEKRKPKKQPKTRIVTTGNTVRIETPQGKYRRPQGTSVTVSSDEFVGGFLGFLREHAIVGLAVGFVVGTQVQTVVKQLIASFIDPLFQLLFARNLSQVTFTWHFHGRHANFGSGAFMYVLLDFVFILIAVYAIIRIFKLDKFDKPKEVK